MSERIISIEAGKENRQYWKDIWFFRDLFYFLAWRDIQVRYKQMVLGVAWSIIRPLLTMVTFTIIFGRIAKFPSEGVPYSILVFSSLLPWNFFSTALTESSNSMIANAGIVSKVYFPRVIMPVSSILVSLIDFLVSLVLLFGLMAFYQFVPSIQILMLPFFLGLAFLLSVGLGLWLAALNVKYRDFRYVVPFAMQLALYVSPVGFSTSVIPQEWRLLYSLNPMVGVIDGFRWSIIGPSAVIYAPALWASIVTSVFVFFTGFHYFRRAEKGFADII